MSEHKFLGCSESSTSSPIGFFTSFVRKKEITKAIEQFHLNVPDRSNEFDYRSSSLSYISEDKLEFHLEHTIVSIDDPSDLTTYKSHVITEIVSFEKEMEKVFRKQFSFSKQLLKKKYDAWSLERGKKKQILANIRDILADHIFDCIEQVDSDPVFKRHKDLCLRPFYAIIRFLYRDFPTYCPLYNFDSRIPAIIQGAADAEDLYQPQILDLKVVDDLMQFCLLSSERLFTVDNVQADSANLKLILGSTEIIPPPCVVCVRGRVGAINYTIGLLLERLGISRPAFDRWGCLKIGKHKFMATECDREFSRYPDLHPDDASRIRYLINSHMV
jgi:hypothetical protein